MRDSSEGRKGGAERHLHWLDTDLLVHPLTQCPGVYLRQEPKRRKEYNEEKHLHYPEKHGHMRRHDHHLLVPYNGSFRPCFSIISEQKAYLEQANAFRGPFRGRLAKGKGVDSALEKGRRIEGLAETVGRHKELVSKGDASIRGARRKT